ncbi:MAG: hypothetical protein U5K75_06650 [Ahrensia sp.]|nr:hypothetical protein [Ahrensia sp.]
MFNRIINSWNLAKECWRVLTLDKEMLLFPILSAVTTIFALMLVSISLREAGVFEYFTAHISNSSNPDLNNLTNGSSLIMMLVMMLAITIVLTLITYTILTFFNTGLITCAFIRLCGEIRC